MSTAGIVILIIVVVVALAVTGWLTARRRAQWARLGPEYERKHAAPELKPPAPEARAGPGPGGDRAINNTVPMSVPGHEPWRLS